MEKEIKNNSTLKKASAIVLLAVASIPYVAATASVIKALKTPKNKK